MRRATARACSVPIQPVRWRPTPRSTRTIRRRSLPATAALSASTPSTLSATTISPSARSSSARKRASLAGVASGEVIRRLPMPPSVRRSASPMVATALPIAPAASWRRATSTDLWVLACGLSATPCRSHQVAICTRLRSNAARSSTSAGVHSSARDPGRPIRSAFGPSRGTWSALPDPVGAQARRDLVQPAREAGLDQLDVVAGDRERRRERDDVAARQIARDQPLGEAGLHHARGHLVLWVERLLARLVGDQLDAHDQALAAHVADQRVLGERLAHAPLEVGADLARVLDQTLS